MGIIASLEATHRARSWKQNAKIGSIAVQLKDKDGDILYFRQRQQNPWQYQTNNVFVS